MKDNESMEALSEYTEAWSTNFYKTSVTFAQMSGRKNIKSVDLR